MEKIFNRILFGVLIIFIATLPISPQITEADTRGGGLIPCGGTENPCGAQCGGFWYYKTGSHIRCNDARNWRVPHTNFGR